jgi:hypothetical protein
MYTYTCNKIDDKDKPVRRIRSAGLDTQKNGVMANKRKNQ